MESFGDWLQKELDARGWSRSEAARRSGVSASMYDKVINGYAKPGLGFLVGVTRGLGLSREEIFQQAGWLPKLPDDSPNLHDCLHLFRQLSPDRQDVILTEMRALVDRQSIAD